MEYYYAAWTIFPSVEHSYAHGRLFSSLKHFYASWTIIFLHGAFLCSMLRGEFPQSFHFCVAFELWMPTKDSRLTTARKQREPNEGHRMLSASTCKKAVMTQLAMREESKAESCAVSTTKTELQSMCCITAHSSSLTISKKSLFHRVAI